MNKTLLVALGVLLVVVVAVVAFVGGSGKKEAPAKSVSAPQNQTSQPAASPAQEQGSSVVYTDSGFSPNTLTVKQGTTVTFKNGSSTQMRVASAVHPTHDVLPGFDQLKGVEKGGIYTYTFEKKGSWKYHNHLSPSETGIIVVE